MIYAFHEAAITMPVKFPDDIEWCCAMLQYAEVFGAKRADGQYRWHKLTAAYETQYGAANDLIESAHDALADCRMTAALWCAMSEPETMVTSSEPAIIRFTHIQRKLTKRNDAYAAFTTPGGITLNIFDRQFGEVNVAGADLPAWIEVLASKPADYVHPLKAPLRLTVDFSNEYPELWKEGNR